MRGTGLFTSDADYVISRRFVRSWRFVDIRGPNHERNTRSPEDFAAARGAGG
jgi:hypothetical protein